MSDPHLLSHHQREDGVLLGLGSRDIKPCVARKVKSRLQTGWRVRAALNLPMRYIVISIALNLPVR